MRILVGAFSVVLAFLALIQSCASGVMTIVSFSNFGTAMSILILCILFVFAGLLQGAGAEVGFAIRKYNNFGILSFTLTALFIILFVTIRDYFIFGYNLLPIGTLLIVILIRIAIALVIGRRLSYDYCKRIAKSRRR